MKKRGLSVSKSTCQPRQPVSLMNLSFTACLTKSYPPWGKNFLVLRMRSSRVSSLYFRLFCRQSEKPKPETQASGDKVPRSKNQSQKEKNLQKERISIALCNISDIIRKIVKTRRKISSSGRFFCALFRYQTK